MTTRSTDPSETGSIFESGEVAEQWHRGKAERDEKEKVSGTFSACLLLIRRRGR
jgi:hypothetical protein